MTEVANLLVPAGHSLTAVRRYEALPPEGVVMVEPGETVATTKEEEWVSKKTTEVTNTKQIETRVKRQIVLEDGKVVEDSGPMVTTNTTEDSEKQEYHQTELRKLGEDGEKKDPEPEPKDWVVVANPDGVVREVKERRVISREETEELKETEDVQHLGEISDKEFLDAVKDGDDIKKIIKSKEGGRNVVSTGPRLVHQSVNTNKVTDTEDTRELSSVAPDGRIVTETQRTTEHEELKDNELPPDAPDQNYHLENSQRYSKTRDQEDVEYYADDVKVGHEMRFKAETMDVERRGDGIDEPDFDSLSARRRQARPTYKPIRGIKTGVPTGSPLDRKDALTRKPLDFDREEETRKVETSKWLEHHFGSESRSSHDSFDDEEETSQPKTSYFNVTIKSQPLPQSYINSINTARKESSHQTEYFHGISDWSSRSPHYQPAVETTPTPPQRKKAVERRQRAAQNSYLPENPEEPPPDYSPPSPPPMPGKKQQKTRFAIEASPKAKSGNIIGQSIRKLVDKIRSASAERKAKQRVKRSPSPSYQQGHVIDNLHHDAMDRRPRQGTSPARRYYLGEDPFSGSIYGKENKYDGVKPARTSRKTRDEELRSQSTLGRLDKTNYVDSRNSQTLPRHPHKYEPPSRLDKNNRSNSTINVSFINTVTPPPYINGGPAKPIRTFRSNLARSKSFNVDLDATRPVYKNTSQLHRLDEAPAGLKSPGLISSISRSQRDLTDLNYRSTFARNGYKDSYNKESYTNPVKSSMRNGDIFEPPTRLKDTNRNQPRRGSNSSNDFSETYHTTTRNDDPKRPSVTDTVQTFSKKTLPAKDGRGVETIESTETKSVTKSRYRDGSNMKYYEDRRGGPVVIEVRNNYK